METSVLISLLAVILSALGLLLNGRKVSREDAAGSARRALYRTHPAFGQGHR